MLSFEKPNCAAFHAAGFEQTYFGFQIEPYLMSQPKQSMILRIMGDFLQDFGIFQGDIGIINLSRSPKNGDIILGEYQGNYILRYFFREKSGKIILRSGKKDIPDFSPEQELRIIGVMESLIRKFF